MAISLLPCRAHSWNLPGVEAEDTDASHHLEHSRESDGQDGSESEADRYGPSHANLSMGEREDFSGVCERDRSFSR